MTEDLRARAAQLVEQACKFNCDAESGCNCYAHELYRLLVAEIVALQQQYAILDHVVGSISRVLTGESVSDFDLSYTEVRAAADLKSRQMTPELRERAEQRIRQLPVCSGFVRDVTRWEQDICRECGLSGDSHLLRDLLAAVEQGQDRD